MTSATEILRRLLDERGVEWWEATPCKTKWNSPIIGGPVAAREWNGEMVLDTGYIAVTPEQAIAATLGSCNCSNNCTNSERTGTCHDVCNSVAEFTCSACGFNCDLTSWISLFDGDDGRHRHHHHGTPNYCPNCGRRIEQ